MSKPKGGNGPRLHHVPGLDGIRALAVLAVITFHNGFSWAPGGYYGVDAFFVLSGFLITSLLVTEWRASGTVSLGRFWARRARRLLPALYVLVAAIGVVVIFWPSIFGTVHLLPSAVASLFYAANWFFVANGSNYFAASSSQSPFLHTWSLAIEEQFYLIWPLVVLTVLRGFHRRSRSTAKPDRGRAGLPAATQLLASADNDAPETVVQVVGEPEATLTIYAGPVTSDPQAAVDGALDRDRRLEILFALAAFGALGSALLMAFMTPFGSNPNRAYYGTDTRAQAILVGAALAVAFARWGSVRTTSGRRAIGVVAVAGLVGTLALWGFVHISSSLAFHGGFLLAALFAAAMVAGAVHLPGGAVTRLLSVGPLKALGKISYGVYLWYWPVLLVMTGQRTHLSIYPLFFARVAVTIAIAAVSYFVVEQPIRHGVFPSWKGLVAVPIGAGVAICAMAVASVSPLVAPTLAVTPASESSSAAVAQTLSTVPGGSGNAPVPAAVVPKTTVTVAPAAHPTRVLLLGDSASGSLGTGLGEDAARYNVQLFNEGSPGCSVSMAQQIQVLGTAFPPGTPCKEDDPNALLDQWQQWVDEFNPDVVVYLARGELFDQQLDGQWSNLGQPTFDSYVTQRFQKAISVLSSKGAAVALLSSPYYDSGDQPVGTPWPEDDPARVVTDDAIMKKAVTLAQTHGATTVAQITNSPLVTTSSTVSTSSGPATVSLINFGAMASPGAHYSQVVNGVTMRCSDGVHFTPAGGAYLGNQLLPALVQLGHNHQAVDPQTTFTGLMPPTTPIWYDKLPCG